MGQVGSFLLAGLSFTLLTYGAFYGLDHYNKINVPESEGRLNLFITLFIILFFIIVLLGRIYTSKGIGALIGFSLGFILFFYNQELKQKAEELRSTNEDYQSMN